MVTVLKLLLVLLHVQPTMCAVFTSKVGKYQAQLMRYSDIVFPSLRGLICPVPVPPNGLLCGRGRDRIFVIGSPEIDVHRSFGYFIEFFERYEIPVEHYGICVFTRSHQKLRLLMPMLKIFDALENSDRYFVVIKPNNDPGNQIINARLEKLALKVSPNPLNEISLFFNTLRHAYCRWQLKHRRARGSAIGVPSLNIGSRQTKRASGPSIVNCLASIKLHRFFLKDLGARISI